jgi:YaaC-like Protein
MLHAHHANLVGVMTGASKARRPAPLRTGDPLRVGPEPVIFGRNILVRKNSAYELQHRFFVNDPWELMAEAIARAVAPGKSRDIAQSFRRQAEDYFRAATAGRELAVRPVLLYYAFLNLSKAYGVAKGNASFASKALHGISCEPKPKAIPQSLVKFPRGKGTLVFPELLKLLDGNAGVLGSDLRLGYLLPQILPGHRLWCYATGRAERFLTVEKVDILHLPATKQVWLNLYLNRNDLGRLKMSEENATSRADLAEFEFAGSSSDSACFQQRNPDSYSADPAEALALIIRRNQNRIWETVKTASPYRKPYIYCCPPAEQGARLPQLLSIYLLMFFLGSVTRYSPGDFDDILDSKYGPFFDTFVSESPMQFLYLMASDLLGREISKPAII